MRKHILLQLISSTITLIVFASPVFSRIEPVVLTDDRDVYRLDRNLEILEDKKGEWNIKDISSSRFESLFRYGRFNLGLSSSVFWCRFSLENTRKQPCQWILVDNFGVHYLDLYYQVNGGVFAVRRAGFRDSEYFKSVALLPMIPKNTQTYYLRIRSNANIVLPLEICTEKYFIEKSRHRMMLIGAYFGIILSMIFYNLFIYFSLPEKSRLDYILYILFIALYFAGIHGLLVEYIIPGLPELSSILVLLFLNFALFWVILFSKSFLMTSRLIPRTDKVLNLLMIVTLVFVVMAPWVNFGFLIRGSFVIAGGAPLALLMAGFSCLKLGYRPARFFLIAFTTVIIGALVYNLTLQGILPYTRLTANLVEIGSAIEAILLSLALADRIKIMGKEKEMAQEETHQTLISTIQTLAEAIEKRDPYTGGHTKRVMKYSIAIGHEMDLSKDEIERLRLAAVLHDIGKIGIRDSVLLKDGKLTDEEFEIIKKHPAFGDEILQFVMKLQEIIPGIRSHHERYDGKGYPDRIEGIQIENIARIIAVADSFDAMTSERPYRKGMNKEAACNELRKNAGTQFDPMVVEAFLRVLSNNPG